MNKKIKKFFLCKLYIIYIYSKYNLYYFIIAYVFVFIENKKIKTPKIFEGSN